MILVIYLHRGLDINKKSATKINSKFYNSQLYIKYFSISFYNLAQMCTTYNLDLYFAYIVHIKQSFPTIFFSNTSITKCKYCILQGSANTKIWPFFNVFSQKFEIFILSCCSIAGKNFEKKCNLGKPHTLYNQKG